MHTHETGSDFFEAAYPILRTLLVLPAGGVCLQSAGYRLPRHFQFFRQDLLRDSVLFTIEKNVASKTHRHNSFRFVKMALLYRNGRAISSALQLRFMKKTYHLTLHSRIFPYFRSVDAFSLRRIFQTLRVLCHCGEKAQQPARNGGKHFRTCRDEALEIADEFCITPFGSAVGNDERSARKAFHRSGGDP